jgi:murein DD-endopeptidase MepM/ murein hydrolase activator NlpD
MPMPFSNPSTYPGHGGIDFAKPSGTPIPSILDGVVTFQGLWGRDSAWGPAGGITKTVTRSDGLKVMFCHLKSLEGPGLGAKIKKGNTIAFVGNTGHSTGPHLHIEFWLNGVALNEWDWMNASTWIGKPVVPGTPAGQQPSPYPYSVVTADRQRWLNGARGEKLVVDGRLGPATVSAIKRYQAFLRVKADGVWGRATQAAHQLYYNKVMHPVNKPLLYPVVTPALMGRIGNVQGLQKIAKLGGYTGKIDNRWGPGSTNGFSVWISRNYGTIDNWLRRKWGYSGDNRIGPNMIAALQRANAANLKAL